MSTIDGADVQTMGYLVVVGGGGEGGGGAVVVARGIVYLWNKT
jgi:hypothetical protein